MKRVFLLVLSLAWASAMMAQSGDAGQQGAEQKPAAAQAPSTGSANPFPEDTSTVPVMPNAKSPAFIPANDGGNAPPPEVRMAGDDTDPIRSPDDVAPEEATPVGGDSSSARDVDRILGAPGDEGGYKQDRKHRREREQPEPKQQTHKEAAAEDINVGSYYLDKKNWRAAQSRYQSAMVLDPENPEVYWGLAESAYHLGDLAAARGYYLKVFEYDPDGPHGKQLKKILKDPALLNAKAIVAVAPATPDQQKP